MENTANGVCINFIQGVTKCHELSLNVTNCHTEVTNR